MYNGACQFSCKHPPFDITGVGAGASAGVVGGVPAGGHAGTVSSSHSRGLSDETQVPFSQLSDKQLEKLESEIVSQRNECAAAKAQLEQQLQASTARLKSVHFSAVAEVHCKPELLQAGSKLVSALESSHSKLMEAASARVAEHAPQATAQQYAPAAKMRSFAK